MFEISKRTGYINYFHRKLEASFDIEMEDHRARPKATFRFNVPNVRDMKDSVLSPPCYVRNLPWTILVKPHQAQRDGQQLKYLGFFLQCNAKSKSTSWSCYAEVELRLISHNPDNEPYCRRVQHMFDVTQNDWGFPEFMYWHDVVDPEKGYINNDSITLEVYVTTEAFQGGSSKHTGNDVLMSPRTAIFDSSDWQLKCGDLKQRGAYLLQSGRWSDCEFLVGPPSSAVRFKGHKIFLAMASPVFEAMLYRPITEGDQPINITDTEPDTFEALLEYLYTDNISLSSIPAARALYYVAQKYMLPQLSAVCTTYMTCNMTAQYACTTYEFAQFVGEEELSEHCKMVIQEETNKALASRGFTEVSTNTVRDIFAMNSLSIDSEVELLRAAERYVKENAKEVVLEYEFEHQNSTAGTLQKPMDLELQGARDKSKPELKEAIQQVRFLTLTPQQLVDHQSSTSLLKDHEILALLMNICSEKSPMPIPEGFSTSKELRGGKNRKQATIHMTVTLSDINKGVDSPEWYIRNRAWTVHLLSSNSFTDCHKRPANKCLAFYVTFPDDDTCRCLFQSDTVTFKIICHDSQSKSYCKTFQLYKVVDEKNSDVLLPLKELTEENGYLKDNCITLEGAPDGEEVVVGAFRITSPPPHEEVYTMHPVPPCPKVALCCLKC